MSGSGDLRTTRPGGLPPVLLELQELLAEKVHDAWTRQRIAEGWVLGTARDEQARTRPGLVRNEELREKHEFNKPLVALDCVTVALENRSSHLRWRQLQGLSPSTITQRV